ncbi:MAG: ATP-binding protein [Candidatus Desantisbacteria bacterium]
MINKAVIKNFGTLTNIKWENLGKINLIIGENSSGKTFLLKALYSTMRTIEEYKRGDDKRSENEILSEKLYWTFQTEKIGDLVSKTSTSTPCKGCQERADGDEKFSDLVAKTSTTKLSCEITFDNKEFHYQFGKDTTKIIQSLTNRTSPRMSNSIFLPSKEVLSIYHLILESREKDKLFGFDDTYLDLVRALALPRKGGESYPKFANSRKALEDILGGKVEYDEITTRWQFKKGNQKFAIGVTAEGIKKIAILDSLLANRYLDTESIIFIDEPESALHPAAISKLLDIIKVLAHSGIQFFLASHSYFVIKKLYLIARKNNFSIPFISLNNNQNGEVGYDDLLNGMPDNSIIDESIRLYKEEISGVLG